MDKRGKKARIFVERACIEGRYSAPTNRTRVRRTPLHRKRRSSPFLCPTFRLPYPRHEFLSRFFASVILSPLVALTCAKGKKRRKGKKEKRKKGKKEENTGGKVNRVERLSDWLLLPIVSFAIATLSSVASILFARHVSGSMLAIVFPFPSNLPAGFLWPSIRRLYIKGKRKHRSN